MKVKEILNKRDHRPWEMPSEGWKFYQEWNRAIFLHWEVDLHELQKFVPNDLEIDLFEGKPWVSLVAFTMEKIRPKYLPSFPPISNFDEINIRTYVKKKNKTGVYFLSIEGGASLSCRIAQSISALPYRYSKMERLSGQFISSNSNYNDSLSLRFEVGQELEQKTTLDKWLTERYALFQDTPNSINEFEIHHLEWPVNKINLQHIDLSYNRFSSLINNKPNRVHYSKGVQVIAWGKIVNERIEEYDRK